VVPILESLDTLNPDNVHFYPWRILKFGQAEKIVGHKLTNAPIIVNKILFLVQKNLIFFLILKRQNS